MYSSLYELKSEQDGVGVVKVEKYQDNINKSPQAEDEESGERKHGRTLKRTFDCIECKKNFSRKYCVDGHIVAQHSNNAEMMKSVTCKIHRCKQCRYITIRKRELTQHMRTHGEKVNTTFDCTKCGKVYSSKFGLDRHIVSSYSDDTKMMKSVTNRIHRCKHCRYITVHANEFTQHIRTHGKKLQTFDCIKCGKKFSNKQSLDGHIVAHHGDNAEMMKIVTRKIHNCKQCEYITIHTGHMSQHVRTHKGKIEGTFDCMRCNKEFSSKFCLDGHILLAHGDDAKMVESVTRKIHRCKQCKYITIHATGLTRHMRMHGEKFETFDCIECGNEFSCKQTLHGHIVALHRNNTNMMKSVTHKVHRCNVCKYITVQGSNLVRHMRTHEKLEPL